MGKNGKENDHRESEAIFMIEQYKKQAESYKDIYQEETSQIHAPVDLVLETKRAVAEEERRRQRKSWGWLMPITGVAALVFIFNISKMQFSHLYADLAGGSSGASSAEYEVAEVAPAKEEMDKAMDGAFQNEGEITAGSIAEDEYREESATAETGGEETKEDFFADHEASADLYDGLRENEEAKQKSVKRAEQELAAQKMTIVEAAKEPDFYRTSDTESTMYCGLLFYITTDSFSDIEAVSPDGWKAYVEYGPKKYIITGGAQDQEEFLEKAYGLLLETGQNED